MLITVLAFDGITALDAVGPYEILSRLPGARLQFAGETTGEVRTDSGFLGLTIDVAIADVDRSDVLVIPGGPGTRRLLTREPVLEWVRSIHPTTRFTTSVCTGSLVLAVAGVLADTEATTHWSCRGLLDELGARPVAERVVQRDKVVTAAGVSAGIDMALTLAEQLATTDVAKAIQLGIEYDPQPPFDCGSADRCDPAFVDRVRAFMASQK